jgi:hypothetical protein
MLWRVVNFLYKAFEKFLSSLCGIAIVQKQCIGLEFANKWHLNFALEEAIKPKEEGR